MKQPRKGKSPVLVLRKSTAAEGVEIRKGVKEMKAGKVKTIASQDLIKRLEKI